MTTLTSSNTTHDLIPKASHLMGLWSSPSASSTCMAHQELCIERSDQTRGACLHECRILSFPHMYHNKHAFLCVLYCLQVEPSSQSSIKLSWPGWSGRACLVHPMFLLRTRGRASGTHAMMSTLAVMGD